MTPDIALTKRITINNICSKLRVFFCCWLIYFFVFLQTQNSKIQLTMATKAHSRRLLGE